MNFTKQFKTELRKKNLTQSDFSRILGCSRGTVSSNLKYWEAGHSPNIKTLKKWCKAINIDYKKFIDSL